MRSRKVLLGFACLAANTMLLNGTAHADRRTGLGGNLLIEDKKDIFPFPQYTLKYRNMLNADYGATGGTGQGVMTFGTESMAFGLAAHRGDILQPDFVGFNSELGFMTGVQNPFSLGAFGGAPPPVTPATFIDLVGAMSLSDTSSVGLRLGFGRGANLAFNDGDGTGTSQTFITAQVGFSTLPPEGLRLDVSGNVLFALANSQAAGETVDSGLRFRVGALARAYMPLNDVVDIGVIGNLNVNNESVKNDPADASANDFSLGFMAGVGPVVHVERATLAAYAGVLVGYGKSEPNDDVDDNEVSRLNFVVPDMRMSAEVQLLDWLYVRTGLDYLWQMNSQYFNSAAAGNPAAGNDGKTRTSGGAYQWNAGLGVVKGNFALDGVISNAFMTNGPAFVGGGTPGFLGMASLTYRFGDVFSGGVAAQEAGATAPAPAPAPEPVPEPAPAVEEPAPSQEGEPAVDATGTTTGTTTGTSTSTGGTVGASGNLQIGR